MRNQWDTQVENDDEYLDRLVETLLHAAEVHPRVAERIDAICNKALGIA